MKTTKQLVLPISIHPDKPSEKTEWTLNIKKSPYLCNVFFIVLDFKVNKGWSTAVLLFLCPYVSYPIFLGADRKTIFSRWKRDQEL